MASAKDDKQFKYDAGNTLLALREKAGMTQPELAEKIHVEPNSVHRYEKGERQMSLHAVYTVSVTASQEICWIRVLHCLPFLRSSVIHLLKRP